MMMICDRTEMDGVDLVKTSHETESAVITRAVGERDGPSPGPDAAQGALTPKQASHHRVRVTALLLGILGLVGGAWWLGSRVQSPAARAARAEAPLPSLVTARVEQRVLAETLVTRGDVRPSGASQVVWSGSNAAGAPLVTGVPVKVGGTVLEGQVVAEVSGRPVLVIAGSVPVYRDLRPGSSGKDVAQLQAALARLGFSGMESDGMYGPGTKAAVAAWYQQVGFVASTTTTDGGAQLSLAASAVSTARQHLSEVQSLLDEAGKPKERSVLLQLEAAFNQANRTLDQARLQASEDNGKAAAEMADAKAKLALAKATGPETDIAAAAAAAKAAEVGVTRAMQSGESAIATASEAVEVAQASLDEATAKPDVVKELKAVADAAFAVADAEKAFAMLDTVTGTVIQATELLAVRELPARVDTVNAVVGGKAEGALVTFSTSAFVVESTLSPAMKQLVQPGAVVKIDDDLSGATYNGKVTAVADTLTTPTGGQSGQAGYLATIGSDIPIDPKLLSANVRVTITGQSSAGEVLVVPVAAIFAQADGTNAVTRAVDGQQTLVKVETGLSAGGFVALTKSSLPLSVNDAVVVGQ
jgi:peptidoglycan hydrolase-like protein with peptidoglycan-binding domain